MCAREYLTRPGHVLAVGTPAIEVRVRMSRSRALVGRLSLDCRPVVRLKRLRDGFPRTRTTSDSRATASP